MQKIAAILLTCLLVTGMTAGTVLAKSEQGNKSSASSKSENKSKGQEKQEERADASIQATVPVDHTSESAVLPETEKPESEVPAEQESSTADAAQVSGAKEKQNNGNGKANGHHKDKSSADSSSVTDDVYSEGKGKQGYKGLLNAMNNVKDKPAGQVLANLLLTQYPTQLTPEMQAELEQIQGTKEALAKGADLLEEAGDLESAALLQQEVIQSDLTDLSSYQRLVELSNQTDGSSDRMNLFINGQSYADATPIVQDGTTLVPFRIVSEALAAEVRWNAKDTSITVVKDGQTIKLYVNKKNAEVNGRKVSLQAAPVMENGTTRVPVRVISEALGATVKWEPVSSSVIIYE